MGAFKFRGAYNALASLGPEERRRGVVAFSSGNHAQAVALAGRLLGIPTDSCWDYTKGPRGRPFRLRLVCFHGSRVEMVLRRWVF